MTTSRRNFLRAGAPATAAGTWLAMADVLRAAPSTATPGNEEYWRLVKRQFPLAEDLVYLNAANVCPASRGVLDRHLEFLRDFQANPSFQNREKYDPIAERTRSKTAALLGVDKEEIAFTRNTSEGSNIVVHGVELKAGDEVVITAHNHPSNNDSWKVRARREGFTVREVPVPIPAASRQQLIDGFEKAITPRTRVLAFTHVTNTTGNYYPAAEIAALGRKHNLWVHLDGAQTLGALDVNLRAIGCDSYAGSAHKWMMGPLEAGVLYVRSERIGQLWPSIVTAGWSDTIAGARKFEVYGQRDNPRLASVEAAVDFLQLIGMSNVEARLRFLVTRAKEQLQQVPGVRLKTSTDPQLSGGVVKFDLAKPSLKAAYDVLYSRHRLAIALTPSGEAQGLRFSPHIYNTVDDIDRAVAAVRETASA
ncbi:MAG: aminotransferase class V-fold PLP-dependent enzyme [Bryobacteraceae bacterium]